MKQILFAKKTEVLLLNKKGKQLKSFYVYCTLYLIF